MTAIICRKLNIFRYLKRNLPRSRKMAFKYPDVRRDDTVIDEYFGVKVHDPYRWLEDRNSQETEEFVKQQNDLTRPYLDSYAHRDDLKEIITKVWNYPKCSEPFLRGSNYFQFKNTGLQNQNVLMMMEDLCDEGKVLLDPNALSEDGTVSLSSVGFSENGLCMAYGLSKSGSDWIEIHIRNVITGEDYPEVLSKVKFSPIAWTHDHLGFFYGAYLNQDGVTDGSETKNNENHKLYYHRVGTKQTEDIVALEFTDPELRIDAKVSDCGNYLVITPVKGCKNNMLYYAHIDQTKPVTEKMRHFTVMPELKYDLEYVTNEGSIFYFRTNKESPNYNIVTIDFNNPRENTWRTLIYEHPNDVLDWAKVVNNNLLILCYLHDCKHTLSVHYLRTGEKITSLPVPMGTITGISCKKRDKQMFYNVTSFLTPGLIYKVDFTDPNIDVSVFHETKVDGLDLNGDYEVKQVFYKSIDETAVPMFLISRRGITLDKERPCILYGYGGFNVSITPSFTVSRIVFIKHFDGIYAVANIRGGGEYGDSWHNAGRFESKQNCFYDFQYAARYLFKNGYTCAEKLTIQGASNGGLLVAACINQRPNLFGAAICQVGVLDMLRFHKFTIGYAWKSDYGSAENEEHFKAIYQYSPLHNVGKNEDGEYPATLLLTADHDDRVVPLHSFKYIAELQYKVGRKPTQKKPLMIRIETSAGHGAGKPTSKLIEEVTDIFSFIAKSLNYTFIR